MFKNISNILSKLFKKPLKVGIISYNYPTNGSTSGVAIHCYNLAKGLALLGCEVHVFTRGIKSKKDVRKTRKIGSGKIILHELNAEFHFNLKDVLISKRLRLSLFENKVLNNMSYENSKRRFDIMHTHGWLTSTAFMLKYFNNLNWVHTLHAVEKKRIKNMAGDEKKLLRIADWVEGTIVDADRLIAVSNKSREEILREFKGSAKKTEVIHNGVNLDLFKPGKRSPKTVLYIGRFSKEKGIKMIPEIAELILKKDKRHKFIAVAMKTEISELSELKEISDKFLELEKAYPGRFRWIKNSLTENEISELYLEAGVYVQPSLYETFGLSVLEAMATGRAVVATKVGGMPEVLGKTGLLAKVDPKDISRKILKLLTNEKLRKKYGKLAIERAKKFDWGIIAQQTLDLYKEVIDENKEKTKAEKK